MFKGFHHIAIICADIDLSKDFYINKLGFQLIAQNYRVSKDSWKVDLKLDDMQLELFTFPYATPRAIISQPESRGLRHLAFLSANIEKERDTLLSKDVKCDEIRIDEYTSKKFFFFYDPDNQPLEVYEE